MKHELALLGEKIDWKYFENEFANFYSNTGKPAMPIRLMVGSLILKRIYNLGDETLYEAWIRDPYMQYFFCGMAHFEDKFPCDPSDFIYDRGEKGQKQIGITKISTPDFKPSKRDTAYQKRNKGKKIRRRAAIEAVIGHLKTDFRMAQNYLSGQDSPQINAFLAATGWNLKKMMRTLKPKNCSFNFFKSTHSNF